MTETDPAFLDDPTGLFAPVEAAWRDYLEAGEATLREVEAAVTETRHAADDDHLFLPDHPLWDRFTAGEPAASSWDPRPLRWVAAGREPGTPEGKGGPPATWPHGLDADDRVRTAGAGRGRRAVAYGDGFHDLLAFRRHADDGPFLPFEPGRGSDAPRGRLTRVLTGADGRMTAAVQINDEGGAPHRRFRTLRRFEYDDAGRYAGETERWFTRGLAGDEAHPEWRPEVAPGYFESVYMRRRVRARYDAAGRLAEVTAYDHDPRKDVVGEEILYGYNPGDTAEGLVAEFSALLARQLPKAVLAVLKATPAAKPLARVALVYSAEHAHCGLPTRLLLASDADAAAAKFDPFLEEAYPHEAAWPPGGRAGKTLNDLHRRLLLAVEGDPAYAEDFQPRPYREVLWKAGAAAHATLAKKRAATADFALFPLDDHGDVDPAEDARETLPAEVAAVVTGGAG